MGTIVKNIIDAQTLRSFTLVMGLACAYTIIIQFHMVSPIFQKSRIENNYWTKLLWSRVPVFIVVYAKV